MAEAYPDITLDSTKLKVMNGKVDVMKVMNGKDSWKTRVELPSVESLRKHDKNVKNHLHDFRIAEIIGDFIPNSISASTKPFKDLNRVSLSELTLDRHSENNYVLIRILEPGVQVIGWLWVIEDDQGNGCILNVYNFPPLELPYVGSVLIIKEPFLKVTTLKIPLIRCDCPSDIVVLRRGHLLYHLAEAVKWKNKLGEISAHEDYILHHPLNLTAREWYEYGNTLYRDGLLALARDSYELSLNICTDRSDPTWADVRSRVCVAYFELGYYEKTVVMADAIPHDLSAAFYAAKAYYKLRNYEAAKIIFTELLSKNPDNIEHLKEYGKTVDRLTEKECVTDSEIERLIGNSRWCPLQRKEFGDFIGPVEVVDIAGKGRGVRLTADVPPNTILMVSMAFASTLGQKRFFNGVLPFKNKLPFEILRNTMELDAEIVETVFKNFGTLSPIVYGLWAGPETGKVQTHCDPNSHYEPICDITIFKHIRHCNSFPMTRDFDGVAKTLGLGLFIFPSYLNHSCLPNVFATFCNDVMIVRSIGPLKAGVELCISYIPGEFTLDKSKLMTSDRGFKCICELCVN